MKWTRIGLVVLGSGWFFPVSCTTSLFVGTRVVAQIDARDVSKGETVHSEFSVVIKSEQDDEPFHVVSLYDLARYEKMAEVSDTPYTDSFLMPRSSGHLNSDTSSFSYEVLEDAPAEQIIEVVEMYHDGDNTIWSRYAATQSSVKPISSRMFYFGYMFAAFPYAIGFAVLLYAVGWYLQRTQRTKRETNETAVRP